MWEIIKTLGYGVLSFSIIILGFGVLTLYFWALDEGPETIRIIVGTITILALVWGCGYVVQHG